MATFETLSAASAQGFSILSGIFHEQELSKLLAALRQRNVNGSRAGIRHAMQYPEVARFAQDQRLTRIASEVLGGPVFPYRATFFNKSPHANWLVVWHQDRALPLRRRVDEAGWGPWSIKDGIIYAHAPATALQRVVALRIHFDPSTHTNGPLRVLPGTHRTKVFTDSEIEQLAARVAPFECTVGLGGIVLMRPLLVHASSKLMSGQPRRVLHIEYTTDIRVGGLELAIA